MAYSIPQFAALNVTGPTKGQGLLGVKKPCCGGCAGTGGCGKSLGAVPIDFSNGWTLAAVVLLGYGLMSGKWFPGLAGAAILGGQWLGQKTEDVINTVTG